MILKTDFSRGGAGELVEYMRKDNDQTRDLRDAAGRTLSQSQLERFVETSKEFGFTRHIILSPATRKQLSEQQMDRLTRKTMNEFVADRPSARYTYVVHTGRDEGKHIHVAMTGEEHDCHMDVSDIENAREQAAEQFRERELGRTQEQDLAHEHLLEKAVELEHE